MPLVLRRNKTSPLTYSEMDGNFEYIQGLTNNILSEDEIRNLFTSDGRIVYDNLTGTIGLNSDFIVSSFNGRTGDIALTKSDFSNLSTDDISEGLSNLYYSEDRVLNFIKNSITTDNGLNKVDTLTGFAIVPNNFSIRLSGAVSGNATVQGLSDVVINTALDPSISVGDGSSTGGTIEGITGVLVRSPGQLSEAEFQGIEFSPTDFNVVATDTYVSISSKLNNNDIIDAVGSSISGSITDPTSGLSSESGINVNYDNENNAIQISPRDFSLTLTGAVGGTATISRLADTIITVENINNYISGIDIKEDSVPVNSEPITSLSFNAEQFHITNGEGEVSISLTSVLTDQDVRDIVGNTIVGTERDLNLGTVTETGIIVNYDANNNVLEVAPRDFTITLAGDVTGSATISRLQDITINTVADAISGIGVQSSGFLIAQSAKTFNFSDNFAITKDTAGEIVGVDIANIIDASVIRDSVKSAFTGSQNGITVAYDNDDEQFSFNLNDLELSLTGAVTGSATLAYSGNNLQTLNIVTESGNLGAGVEVRDEGETKGESISAINFVGAGVTSSVSVDGQLATVNIPNSPAAEKFILIDNGSANVPNARRLVAGTGIVLNDAGPGQNITISASGGEVLGKIQVEDDGVLTGASATVNFSSSVEVFFNTEYNEVNDKLTVFAYSKLDGWWRQSAIDHGDITDKYGSSLDLGNIGQGIIEHQIDFGAIA